MAAITVRRRLRVFATAQMRGPGFGRRELQGHKARPLVTAIAKGLRSTLAAGTPKTILSRFDRYRVGCFL